MEQALAWDSFRAFPVVSLASSSQLVLLPKIELRFDNLGLDAIRKGNPHDRI